MKTIKHVLCVVTFSVAAQVTAAPLIHDEADEVLARNQELSAMEFKRDQMKLQAEMASSIKEMIDAGVLVDEAGKPLGIESLTVLANDVRDRAKNVPAANPFAMHDPMGGMPIERPYEPVPEEPQRAPAAATPAEPPKALQLVQINADSVILRTVEGDKVLRIGETVAGMKLTSFDASRAYLKGKDGTEVLRIEWARPRR